MDDIIDLLQVKIENAKAKLPEATLNAINAVDWKAVILGMREKHGYTFEQLGDLDLETELVLCGLSDPKDYPKEIQTRMGLTKEQTNDLVREMNDLVFSKIKEELIKNSERKKTFTNNAEQTNRLNPTQVKEISSISGYSKFRTPSLEEIQKRNEKAETKKTTANILGSAEIKIVETKEKIHPMLKQKFSGSFQMPTIKTEHSLDNLSKPSTEEMKTPVSAYPAKQDPYRLPPE